MRLGARNLGDWCNFDRHNVAYRGKVVVVVAASRRRSVGSQQERDDPVRRQIFS